MSTSTPVNIKHFVLVCPRALEPSIIETALESTKFPFHLKHESTNTVFKALPRLASEVIPEQFDAMVCGDSQDFDSSQSMFLGNGIHIWQAPDGSIAFASSLSGLPALYVYRDESVAVVADSIDSIARLSFCSLHFDLQSVAELARIGAPINFRTLFKEVSIVPAASMVSVRSGDVGIEKEAWQPASVEPYSSQHEYIEGMADLMRCAIGRMQLDHSFLALTAGLDTRAVLAALTERHKNVATITISGADLTLDAMRAAQLSDAYGLQHNIVSIDDALAEKVPDYATLASRFSGGLSSIEQATEIYFYETAEPDFDGRISGNLGNQIGRSGTEGTGMRNARVDALAGAVREAVEALDQRHWFYQANDNESLLAPDFLIQRENLFAQLGNYSIGHEMMNQHTPYADRLLIEGKFREPLASRANPGSIAAIKMRDLKHRIFGQSPKRSFQCRVVQDAGGAVADCPINWGWKTSGRFSLPGLYYGAKAFSDIAIGKRLDKVPGITSLLNVAGIKGFSNFHTRHILYGDAMCRFTRETLLDRQVRESGMFDSDRLDRLIDKGFDDETNYDEIVLALDIALAIKNFGAHL